MPAAPPPILEAANAVEVVFAPSPTPPVPAPEQSPKVAETPPPPAPKPPPPVAAEPPPPSPPTIEAETPPSRPKPTPKPRPHRTEFAHAPPSEAPLLTLPQSPPAVAPPTPQVAAVPRPPPQSPSPAAAVSTQYRSLLAGWLEAHKRYPDSARQQGEEGRAVLRFRVDRSGHVLGFTVIGSTGHADLDTAVEAMMRGATMPAFPAGMADQEIEATVAIRFSLAR